MLRLFIVLVSRVNALSRFFAGFTSCVANEMHSVILNSDPIHEILILYRLLDLQTHTRTLIFPVEQGVTVSFPTWRHSYARGTGSSCIWLSFIETQLFYLTSCTLDNISVASWDQCRWRFGIWQRQTNTQITAKQTTTSCYWCRTLLEFQRRLVNQKWKRYLVGALNHWERCLPLPSVSIFFEACSIREANRTTVAFPKFFPRFALSPNVDVIAQLQSGVWLDSWDWISITLVELDRSLATA